jgi:hypothetical protein
MRLNTPDQLAPADEAGQQKRWPSQAGIRDSGVPDRHSGCCNSILGCLGCWHGGWRPPRRCSTAAREGERIHMDADAALVIAGVVHHPDEGCCCSGPLANDGWRWRFLLANTCRRSSWRLWHTMEPASVPGPYYDVDSASGPMRNFSTLLYLSAACGSLSSESARVPFSKTIMVVFCSTSCRGDSLCYVCLSQTHNGCRDNNSLSTRPVKCALCEGTAVPNY